jgi:hypothetical protein
VLRQLSHDNIISYEDHFFDDEGSLCIVTCLCEEGELATRISERRKAGQLFTESEVMDMFIQVGGRGGGSSSGALCLACCVSWCRCRHVLTCAPASQALGECLQHKQTPISSDVAACTDVGLMATHLDIQ